MKLPSGYRFAMIVLSLTALMMMGVTGWCLAQPGEEKARQNLFQHR